MDRRPRRMTASSSAMRIRSGSGMALIYPGSPRSLAGIAGDPGNGDHGVRPPAAGHGAVRGAAGEDESPSHVLRYQRVVDLPPEVGDGCEVELLGQSQPVFLDFQHQTDLQLL